MARQCPPPVVRLARWLRRPGRLLHAAYGSCFPAPQHWKTTGETSAQPFLSSSWRYRQVNWVFMVFVPVPVSEIKVRARKCIRLLLQSKKLCFLWGKREKVRNPNFQMSLLKIKYKYKHFCERGLTSGLGQTINNSKKKNPERNVVFPEMLFWLFLILSHEINVVQIRKVIKKTKSSSHDSSDISCSLILVYGSRCCAY